jgi:uncharacterized protein (DUF2249 family)
MRRTVILDVRPEISAGREPFSKIMSATAALSEDEKLLLISPFEPVPLFSVMAAKGFSHSTRQDKSGAWRVLFTRIEGAQPAASALTAAGSPTTTAAADVVEVDARGLEPPQPMVTILEAAATMPPGSELLARTDRRPMHLYPHLEERGFTAETMEQSDGSFITNIRRH